MFKQPTKLFKTKVNGYLISTVDLQDFTMGKLRLETMVFKLDEDGESDYLGLFCHRTKHLHEAKNMHEIQTLVSKIFRKK